MARCTIPAPAGTLSLHSDATVSWLCLPSQRAPTSFSPTLVVLGHHLFLSQTREAGRRAIHVGPLQSLALLPLSILFLLFGPLTMGVSPHTCTWLRFLLHCLALLRASDLCGGRGWTGKRDPGGLKQATRTPVPVSFSQHSQWAQLPHQARGFRCAFLLRGEDVIGGTLKGHGLSSQQRLSSQPGAFCSQEHAES